MSTFRGYMHIERLGTDEVENIECGECYIFPKLDGTNSSIWIKNKTIQCGSRSRKITMENDNQGFAKFINTQKKELNIFFGKYPNLILYCEWLVSHTIKTYRQDAWRNYYIFDVYDNSEERYLTFDEYSKILDEFNLSYILPLVIIKNPTFEKLIEFLNNNTYLMQEGEIGEGIVIKRYDYINKFGRTTWAKLVRNEFKDNNRKTMGSPAVDMNDFIEQKFIDNYCTDHFINKTYEKIKNKNEGWTSKMIPELFGVVYYDLIKEEIWNFIKKHKNPKIDFSRVYYFAVQKVKQIKSELF